MQEDNVRQNIKGTIVIELDAHHSYRTLWWQRRERLVVTVALFPEIKVSFNKASEKPWDKNETSLEHPWRAERVLKVFLKQVSAAKVRQRKGRYYGGGPQ